MTAPLDRTPSRTAQAPAALCLPICSLLPSRTSPLPNHTSPSSSRPSAARAGTGEPGWVLFALRKTRQGHVLCAVENLNRQAVAHRSRLKAGMTMERWRSCCICRGSCGTQASPLRRPGLRAGTCKGFAALVLWTSCVALAIRLAEEAKRPAPMAGPGQGRIWGQGRREGLALFVSLS